MYFIVPRDWPFMVLRGVRVITQTKWEQHLYKPFYVLHAINCYFYALITLTPLMAIKGQSRGTIKYTKSDYVIKRRYKWAPTRWPASDTGWLGIPGLRLGCERSADRNPGEPFICSAPIWRERGEKRKRGLIYMEQTHGLPNIVTHGMR